MQKLKKIFVSTILILSMIAAFCPTFTFASSGAWVDIDEAAGTVNIFGNVENYDARLQQAYIVIPADGKTYADFASAQDTEALQAAVKYIGFANVSSNGRYTKNIKVSGIKETDSIYVVYNGTVTNINDDLSTVCYKLAIEGEVTYTNGYDTLDMFILYPGCTLEDYVAEDYVVVAKAIPDVPVNEDGTYKYEISGVADSIADGLLVIAYAGENEARAIRPHERVLTLYVDPVNGDDDNTGLDVSEAFKTIAAAEAAYSAQMSAGCSAEIILCEGNYNSIPATVSPVSPARLTYTGLNGAVIKNTTDIPLSDFSKVTDKTILSRLDKNARGYVYQVNLGNYGITASNFAYTRSSESDAPELFMPAVYLDGKPQTIAKWPNSEYYETSVTQGDAYSTDGTGLYYASFTNDEVSRWQATDDMYLEGFFDESSDWVRDYVVKSSATPAVTINGSTLTFPEPKYGGITRVKEDSKDTNVFDSGKNVFVTVNNFIEGLDMPGEWYVDKDTMTMYYYMPQNTNADVLEITASSTALINVENLSNVTFKNLTFRGTRTGTTPAKAGMIKISEAADGVHFEECIFEQAHRGIYIASGRNIVIENNEFRYIKANAIHIPAGADVRSEELVASANRIANNHFYHCATAGTHGANSLEIVIRTISSEPDVTLADDVIENNLVHGSPYAEAVMYEGLGTKIRYNEFYNLIRYVGDAGVVYVPGRLNMAGNKLEYNYIHDFDNTLKPATSSSGVGIYWDDLTSGQTAENNIFVNKGTATTRAIQAHGKNTTIRNNLIYGTALGATVTARTGAAITAFPGTNSNYKAAFNSLNTTNLTEAMMTKYPELRTLKETVYDVGSGTTQFVPNGNTAVGNVHIAVSTPESGKGVTFTARSLNSLIVPGQSANKTESDVASGSDWYEQYQYKQDYYTYDKLSTTLGLDGVFTDKANHNYTLSNDLTSVSAFTGSFDSDFKLKEGFDMEQIGLTGSFWANRSDDLSYELTYPVNRKISADDGSITLSWTKALYADRYQYRVYTGDGQLASEGEVNAYENAVTVTGLSDGSYYWELTPVNDSREMLGTEYATHRAYFEIGNPDYIVEYVSFLNSSGEEIDVADISDAKYITFDITNNTTAAVTYDLIVVLYNSNGQKLKEVLVHEKALTANVGTTSPMVSVAAPASYEANDLIYVFTWKSNGSLEPIAKKVILK